MQPNAVKVTTEQDWHEQRARNVGASEVAALFGKSPYTTLFTLWHQKAGKIARPDFGSERMEWGSALEPVIAQVMAERMGWKIHKVHRYLTHSTVPGMGASLDYEIVGQPEGVGALEVKNVSIEAFKRDWLVNEDGTVEAPIHIELQLQHQLSVTGWQWGAFAFLVGGNEGHVVTRQRHEPTIQLIESAVAEFWRTIDAGQAPAIEDAGDLAAVVQLFNGKQAVEIDSDEFELLIGQLQTAKDTLKNVKEAEDEIKAKLIALMDSHDAETAIGRGYKVTYKEQSRKEHVIKASTFRVLRVSEVKKGKEE